MVKFTSNNHLLILLIQQDLRLSYTINMTYTVTLLTVICIWFGRPHNATHISDTLEFSYYLWTLRTVENTHKYLPIESIDKYLTCESGSPFPQMCHRSKYGNLDARNLQVQIQITCRSTGVNSKWPTWLVIASPYPPLIRRVTFADPDQQMEQVT